MTQAASLDRAVYDTTAERYDAEKYKSSYSLNPQYDPKEMKEAVGRITYLRDEGAFSLYSVDGAFIVRKVSETFQKHRSEIWQNMQKGYETWRNCWGVGGAVVTIAVVVVGYLCESNPVVTCAGVVAGYATYKFGQNWGNASDAKKEAELWTQPSNLAQEIADKRKAAYTKGFPYIHANNLKNTILQPAEVKTFYMEYFADFCRKMGSHEEAHDQARYNWVKNFGVMNPFALSLMKYGLGEIPQDMQDLGSEFEKYVADVAARKNEFDEQKRLIGADTQQSLQMIENEIAKRVGRSRQDMQGHLSRAKAARDEVFDARHIERCGDCRAAEERFQFEKRAHEAEYTIRVASINTFINREIQEVLYTETRRLKGLSNEEIKSIQTKTDARIQVYKEEKAEKRKAVERDYQRDVAAAKTQAEEAIQLEYMRNLQQLRDWEKGRLSGFSYEAVAEIHKETDQTLWAFENERKAALDRAQNNCTGAISVERARRDEVCKTFPDPLSQEYMQAQTVFQFAKKQAEETLVATSSQVNAEYDAKVQTEKNKEFQILKGFSREEAAKMKQEVSQLADALAKGKAKAVQEAFLKAQEQQGAIFVQKTGFIDAEAEHKIQRAYAVETENQRGLSREEIGQIKHDTAIRTQTLEETRSKEIKPHNDALMMRKGQSGAIRDAVFNAHREKAEQIYSQEKQRLETTHTLNVAVIKNDYKDRIDALKGAKDEALKRVAGKETYAMAKFYGPGKELIARAMSTVPNKVFSNSPT